MKSTLLWYIPLVSDEVNNLVNLSDEVHTETQTQNEFIFSYFQMKCSDSDIPP